MDVQQNASTDTLDIVFFDIVDNLFITYNFTFPTYVMACLFLKRPVYLSIECGDVECHGLCVRVSDWKPKQDNFISNTSFIKV